MLRPSRHSDWSLSSPSTSPSSSPCHSPIPFPSSCSSHSRSLFVTFLLLFLFLFSPVSLALEESRVGDGFDFGSPFTPGIPLVAPIPALDAPQSNSNQPRFVGCTIQRSTMSLGTQPWLAEILTITPQQLEPIDGEIIITYQRAISSPMARGYHGVAIQGGADITQIVYFNVRNNINEINTSGASSSCQISCRDSASTYCGSSSSYALYLLPHSISHPRLHSLYRFSSALTIGKDSVRNTTLMRSGSLVIQRNPATDIAPQITSSLQITTTGGALYGPPTPPDTFTSFPETKDSFSACFWMKMNAISSQQRTPIQPNILTYFSSTAIDWFILAVDSPLLTGAMLLFLDIRRSTGYNVNIGNINVRTWHHYCLVHHPLSTTPNILYVDTIGYAMQPSFDPGEIVVTDTNITGTGDGGRVRADATFWISSDLNAVEGATSNRLSSVLTPSFQGGLADVAIFSGVLSVAHVQQVYQARWDMYLQEAWAQIPQTTNQPTNSPTATPTGSTGRQPPAPAPGADTIFAVGNGNRKWKIAGTVLPAIVTAIVGVLALISIFKYRPVIGSQFGVGHVCIPLTWLSSLTGHVIATLVVGLSAILMIVGMELDRFGVYTDAKRGGLIWGVTRVRLIENEITSTYCSSNNPLTTCPAFRGYALLTMIFGILAILCLLIALLFAFSSLYQHHIARIRSPGLDISLTWSSWISRCHLVASLFMTGTLLIWVTGPFLLVRADEIDMEIGISLIFTLTCAILGWPTSMFLHASIVYVPQHKAASALPHIASPPSPVADAEASIPSPSPRQAFNPVIVPINVLRPSAGPHPAHAAQPSIDYPQMEGHPRANVHLVPVQANTEELNPAPNRVSQAQAQRGRVSKPPQPQPQPQSAPSPLDAPLFTNPLHASPVPVPIVVIPGFTEPLSSPTFTDPLHTPAVTDDREETNDSSSELALHHIYFQNHPVSPRVMVNGITHPSWPVARVHSSYPTSKISVVSDSRVSESESDSVNIIVAPDAYAYDEDALMNKSGVASSLNSSILHPSPLSVRIRPESEVEVAPPSYEEAISSPH